MWLLGVLPPVVLWMLLCLNLLSIVVLAVVECWLQRYQFAVTPLDRLCRLVAAIICVVAICLLWWQL